MRLPTVKLPVQSLNSVWRSEVDALDKDKVDQVNDVPMLGDISVDGVSLDWRSPYDKKHPYQPYLHFTGYLTNIRGALPYGISNLQYEEKDAPRADMFYEFTNQQLQQLVAQGLFTKGFGPEETILNGQTLSDIPIKCKFRILKPDKSKGINYPIVFGDAENLRLIRMTKHNSGYDMTKYLADAATLEKIAQQQEQSENTISRDDDFEEENTITSDNYIDDPELDEDMITSDDAKQKQDREQEATSNPYEDDDDEPDDDASYDDEKLDEDMLDDDDQNDDDYDVNNDDDYDDDDEDEDEDEDDEEPEDPRQAELERQAEAKKEAQAKRRQQNIHQYSQTMAKINRRRARRKNHGKRYANTNGIHKQRQDKVQNTVQKGEDSSLASRAQAVLGQKTQPKQGQSHLQSEDEKQNDTTSAEYLNKVRTNEIDNEDTGTDYDSSDTNDVNDISDKEQRDLQKEKAREARRNRFAKARAGRTGHVNNIESSHDLDNDGIDDRLEITSGVKQAGLEVPDAPQKNNDDDEFLPG